MIRIRRQHLIAQALQRNGAATQEDIVEALAREGISVTQATVSRDLGAIGVVKTPSGYCLPGDIVVTGADPLKELERVLTEYALEIKRAASLVVVRTGPGHAGVIGDALDSAALEEAVGVVAGDDTIFIATVSSAVASKLCKRLCAIAAQGGGVS